MKSSTPASRYTGSRSLGGAPAKITVTFGIVSFNSFASGGTNSGYVSSVEQITTTSAPLSRAAFAASAVVSWPSFLITSKAPTSKKPVEKSARG